MNKLVWLLVPALLVMASCRSAKKATDNGTDKTAPVVTVNTPPATTSKDTQKAPAKPHQQRSRLLLARTLRQR